MSYDRAVDSPLPCILSAAKPACYGRSARRQSGVWQSFVSRARLWWTLQSLKSAIRQERKELLSLPDHLLLDIGIDRADARRESARHPNDLPADRVKRQQLSVD